MPAPLILTHHDLSLPGQGAYEQHGHATIEDWLAKLAELDGTPINTSLYALLLPFDNIGRVGFSREFGMVRSGKGTELLRLLGVGLAAAGKMGQMGWPIGVFRSLGLTPDEDRLEAYLDELIEQRIKVGLAIARSPPVWRCMGTSRVRGAPKS